MSCSQVDERTHTGACGAAQPAPRNSITNAVLRMSCRTCVRARGRWDVACQQVMDPLLKCTIGMGPPESGQQPDASFQHHTGLLTSNLQDAMVAMVCTTRTLPGG